MISLLLILAAIAPYGWLASVEHRTRHRAAHAAIDPRPRPLRMLAHGRHECDRQTSGPRTKTGAVAA